MTIRWTVTTDETGTDVVWECGRLVVDACLFDTGEWIVRYGRERPTVEYARTASYDDAVAAAEACMRTISAGRIAGVDPPR